MPNSFAIVALLAWPAVVLVLCRVLPPAHALLGSLVGGYLLLPYGVSFDLPLLPALEKNSIAALSFLALFPLFGRQSVPSMRSLPADDKSLKTERQPSRTRRNRRAFGSSLRRDRPASVSRASGAWIEWVLVTLVLFTPVLTVLLNGEPLIYGPTILRALTVYDALSMIQLALVALLPYFLARKYLRGPGEQLLLLKALAIAGILYSLLALVEIRLSPQLSRWVYGFLAQSFDQAMRDGGFRPVVFLQHGLWLAIFLVMTIFASLTVWKQLQMRNWLFAALWLLAILVLARSLGALAIAVIFLPVALFLRPKTQVLLASFVAITILSYPVLRGANLIPVTQIAEFAQSLSSDRAGSLLYRVRNEDALLAHANEKPWAGWGGWGRARVYDETGRDTSVTDGIWIITIGNSGWLGYVGQFGLLTLPVVLLALQRRQRNITPVLAGLSIILSASLVDMIPNASLTPITWLVAGALMGGLRRQPVVETPAAASPKRRDLAGRHERPVTARPRAILALSLRVQAILPRSARVQTAGHHHPFPVMPGFEAEGKAASG